MENASAGIAAEKLMLYPGLGMPEEAPVQPPYSSFAAQVPKWKKYSPLFPEEEM